MDSPGKRKEAGNYLLGTFSPTTVQHRKANGDPDGDPCLEMHRRKDAVVSRSALTLDIDHADSSFAEAVELAFPYAAILHTTFSSSPDAPRYRLIVPTSREMAPDEYVVAAHTVMQMLGEEQFDRSSAEPERYMYRPAAKEPSWFSWWELPGDAVDPDELLADFQEDLSGEPIPRPSKTKRDPFEIDGVIGAFNRAYEDWDLLIEEYELPYEKVAEDRYHLVGARSQAGMGPVRDVAGFVYSHHANDPAYGKTCSAFDLVRLHRFGDLDSDSKPQTPVNKLPSHEAMLAVATTDHRAIAQLVGLDFDEVMDDDVATPGKWKLSLSRDRNGKFRDCIQNWDLVRDNDPAFQALSYNELSLSPEATEDLPWREVKSDSRVFTETDRWEAMDYLEREYGFRPTKQRLDALVDVTAGRRVFNPVRDYLQDLVWDGKPRVETCLPGVRATDFTRRVARMVMAAAVARMLNPGCKWDHTLVLYGTEGLGKSWWIDKISRGYSSSLGRIDNKDTLLTMQRSWIMTSDEGHSLRKVDSDAMKEFLTRTHDVFRMPYDRETLVHPRHSVIWSTTNDETFLRRQEGNRRFLIVHCSAPVDFDSITDEYVDQLWAEAVYLYRAGERLYMVDDEAEMAAKMRERFIEEDSLGGAIIEYLDQMVPLDWWDMSPEQRVQWMADRDQGFEAEGDVQITKVCSRQIWKEALGQRSEPKRMDLLEITEALKRLPGWKQLPTRQRIPGYGPQLTFVREDFS
jgi:predicted P-loop ATPase